MPCAAELLIKKRYGNYKVPGHRHITLPFTRKRAQARHEPTDSPEREGDAAGDRGIGSPSLAADHGHALNLNQYSRAREAGHCDERAARKALLEDFLANFSQAIAEPHVVDEDRHGDHVPQSGAADRLDGLVELREDVPHLTLEALLRRAGLAAETHGLAAFGAHGAREGPLLGARIRRIAFLGERRACERDRKRSADDE